jgi:hypothetical protein
MWAVSTGWSRHTDRWCHSHRQEDLTGCNRLCRAAIAVGDCVIIIVIIGKEFKGVVGSGDALMNSGKAAYGCWRRDGV